MCALQAPDPLVGLDIHNFIITASPVTVHTLLIASIICVFLISVKHKIMVILEYNDTSFKTIELKLEDNIFLSSNLLTLQLTMITVRQTSNLKLN